MLTHCLEFPIQPLFNATLIIVVTFYLWMNKGQHDTFTLVVIFLSIDQKPHHVTIGLFETNDTIGQRLARQLKAMLEKFSFICTGLGYVKDEGLNMVGWTKTQQKKARPKVHFVSFTMSIMLTHDDDKMIFIHSQQFFSICDLCIIEVNDLYVCKI